MRTAIALVALSSLTRVCGGEAPPPPPVVTATSNIAKTPAPAAHGGTVVVVDDVQLELVVKGSGEVVAYPVVVAGSAIVPPAAVINVSVPVTVGPPRTVRLDWNPRVASFEGQVTGAQVVVAPADIDVQIVHAGHIRRARAPRVFIVPGTVVVTPPHPRVEARGPNVDIRVAPPSVDVRLNVPGVRVEVGGYSDEHHHGMHEHHDNGRHLGWGNGMGHGMGMHH